MVRDWCGVNGWECGGMGRDWEVNVQVVMDEELRWVGVWWSLNRGQGILNWVGLAGLRVEACDEWRVGWRWRCRRGEDFGLNERCVERGVSVVVDAWRGLTWI